MGTQITLSLNGIDIDYGKNRYWKSHYWLFPPGSLTEIEYRYANDVVDTKPGFQTTLGEVKSRLRHLGYSDAETRMQFDSAVRRWNRTHNLQLTFNDFHDTLTRLDFTTLTSADLEPFIWDFRAYLLSLLSPWDTDGALLEDFIACLDFNLILRVLADRAASSPLPLRWHHQDLVESGWVALDDLTDLDRQGFVIHHTRLFGRLQDFVGDPNLNRFDTWLASQGLPRATLYLKANRDAIFKTEVLTLPSAVRHMIHHPENPNNVLSDEDLRKSTESLLWVAMAVPGGLPGLS